MTGVQTCALPISTVTGAPLELPRTSLPLKAEITVGIHEPGGRVTEDKLTLPVRTRPLFVGLRPLFEEAVALGDDARFELVALDADGKALARPDLSYELVRRDVHWQWYETNSGWKYEAIYKDVPIGSGTRGTGSPSIMRFPRWRVRRPKF